MAKPQRPGKGESVLCLPRDYTVVDTETTGLSTESCCLIEVSALRVRQGRVAAEFSTLIRPPWREVQKNGQWQEGYVDDFIQGLTGITDEMLEGAPLPEETLPQGLTMLPLPGHFFDMCGFRTDDGVWFLADCLSGANIVEKYHVNFIYDVAADLETLDKVCTLEGRLFLPAHAEPVEDIRPLAELNRRKVLEIAELIRSLCREPRIFENVLRDVFTHYQLAMDFNQYVLVGSTVRSYLAYLLDRGELAAEFAGNRLLWRAV